MTITPQMIDSYREILTNPDKHELPYKPITEWFVKSEDILPKHLAFDSVKDLVNIPKFIFYILMDELYPVGKALSGDAGWPIEYASVIK